MEKLLAVMRELREKCPWDQKQTPQSLSKYAIEEAYEVEAAVRAGNANEVRDELGDLLLQVVFQSQMYSEQGAFNFEDVEHAITEKLIRRHPHVFQTKQYAQLNSDDVAELWQQIKYQEKQSKARSRLDAIKHGPAMQQAQVIQENAAQIGFDFANVAGAYEKLNEELVELQQAIQHQDSDEIFDELGDCLFSLINVGRKLGFCSEMALLSTIHKFRTRFAFIEDQAQQQHKNIEMLSLEEMDRLWEQAKQQLKK